MRPMLPTDLQPHPEGGLYREVFRSAVDVKIASGTRSALTHIYFELGPGQFSRFHRVSGDEVWNLYGGGGVRLRLWDGDGDQVETIELSAATECYCHVIPGGWWQAAEAMGGGTLVGCSVAPGFEFDDFDLLEANSPIGQRMQAIAPELRHLLV